MESKKRNSLKPANHTKKIIFLAFLLSLLFHFGGIIYITIKPYLASTTKDKSRDLQTQPELQPNINKKKDNEWVETKARAGNFGTPVFFQDDFESEAVETQQEKPVDNTPEVIENKPEDNVKKEEKEQEIIPEPTSFVIEKPQPKPIQQTKSTPAQKIIQPKPQSQSAKPLSAPKPPLTLSQLSQGFLNHMKHEGNHAIHMLGKKSGRPTDEQIKYERYLQKLSLCLQNSFNIHNNRFPVSATGKDDAHVLLALNKDGSLKHCHILKTSGNRDLDLFITFIFKDASTSFPPVPEYLPHDPFAINYIIMVSNSEESRWRLYRQ